MAKYGIRHRRVKTAEAGIIRKERDKVDNRRLGMIGEDAAAEILRNKGFKILRRNYRCSMGEIDIIAARGMQISFVEVKTRSSKNYGRPCESVGADKQRHIRMAAECYLKEMRNVGYIPAKISFDVMEIVAEHIEGAF